MSSLRISFEKKSSRASTCDWQKLHHRVGSRREPAHLRGAFQSRWLMIVCKKLGGGLVRGANWMGYLWRSAIRHRRRGPMDFAVRSSREQADNPKNWIWNAKN
jgi:hypothetical protein